MKTSDFFYLFSYDGDTDVEINIFVKISYIESEFNQSHVYNLLGGKSPPKVYSK